MRDHANYDADEIKKGAPRAVQIAGRWRLRKNLREMPVNALNRRHSRLKTRLLYSKSIEALSDNGLPDLIDLAKRLRE